MKVPVDLWTFLTAEELDDGIYRPKPSGLKHKGLTGGRRSTAEDVWCKIQQVYEQTAHDPSTAPWETSPPPFEQIYAWAGDRTRRAHVGTHQPALKWLFAFWSVNEASLPPYLAEYWRASDFVDRAVALGQIVKRDRYFTSDEVRTLLASQPFTDSLKVTDNWHAKKYRATAAYKDKVFRFMVFASAYFAPRPSEWSVARVSTFDVNARRLVDWRQLKKNLKPRSLSFNEQHVFQSPSPAYPTVAWYLSSVRPSGMKEGPMIQQIDGSPYKQPEDILEQGINLVLGADSPGPHGLRRFGITEAYLAGWTEDSICRLAGDTWKNVKASYIDWDRVDQIERPSPRDAYPRPPRAMLASNGNRKVHSKDGAATAATTPLPEFSSGPISGFVRI